MMTHPLWRKFYGLVLILAAASGVWLALTRPETPVPSEIEAPSVATTDPLYTVGVFEGRLAVFAGQSNTPQTVYDVFVSSLPSAEQEALHRGIPVQTETALQRLLEDYTG